MAQPRHKAIAAGLALTLTFGALAVPALANTSNPHEEDAVTGDGVLPAPSEFDRDDSYVQGAEGLASTPEAVATTRAVMGLSDEMKYFSKYESNCNYDQGFSYGDGYNAMGYYQFDRRYALVPFIESVYKENPQKYSMFSWITERGQELKTAPIYDKQAKKLTEIGRLADESWHAAYATDPAEFSALQDAYSYNNYYLPIERSLKRNYGVDISGRADCVKGLAWGMCNLFGEGGVQKYFKAANLSSDMTDREMVTALCDAVINHFGTGAGKDHPYAAGYVRRYKGEKRVCLEYVAKHEAEQGQQGGTEAPEDTAKPEPEVKPEAKPEQKPEQKPEVKPETKPEQKPEAKPEAKPEQKPEVKPESKPEQKPEQKPETKPEQKPEVKPETKPEQKPEVKPESKPEQKPEQKPEAKPEQKPEQKPEHKPEVKPEAKPEQKPEAKPEQKPESTPDAESQTKVFTVTFDDCDPSTPNAVFEVKANEAFSAQHEVPAAPVSEGNNFEQWCYYDREAKAYGKEFDPSAPVTEDIYVAASWSPKQFGGSVPEPGSQTALKGDSKAESGLPQTSDAAGIAMAVAAAMSAAGTASLALGGKMRIEEESARDE